jgi:hypothetical protein
MNSEISQYQKILCTPTALTVHLGQDDFSGEDPDLMLDCTAEQVNLLLFLAYFCQLFHSQVFYNPGNECLGANNIQWGPWRPT